MIEYNNYKLKYLIIIVFNRTFTFIFLYNIFPTKHSANLSQSIQNKNEYA